MGNRKAALDKLSDFLESKDDSTFRNQILLISADNSAFENQKLTGVLRSSEISIQNAQLNARILGLLDLFQAKYKHAISTPKENATTIDKKDISELEISGLRNTEKLLLEKLEHFRNEALLAVDPNIKFSLEKSVAEYEARILDIRSKIEALGKE